MKLSLDFDLKKNHDNIYSTSTWNFFIQDETEQYESDLLASPLFSSPSPICPRFKQRASPSDNEIHLFYILYDLEQDFWSVYKQSNGQFGCSSSEDLSNGF